MAAVSMRLTLTSLYVLVRPAGSPLRALPLLPRNSLFSFSFSLTISIPRTHTLFLRPGNLTYSVLIILHQGVSSSQFSLPFSFSYLILSLPLSFSIRYIHHLVINFTHTYIINKSFLHFKTQCFNFDFNE